MKMKHLLIEGFCEGNRNKIDYHCNGNMKLGIHCFECCKFSCTYCPNEMVVLDEEGIVQEGIGFGGEMEPDNIEDRDKYIALWNEICKKKIKEAYEEFIDRKSRC